MISTALSKHEKDHLSVNALRDSSLSSLGTVRSESYLVLLGGEKPKGLLSAVNTYAAP